MEPESINPQTAVKMLMIITAIPVVLFALWADYFVRYLEQLLQENPKYDRELEVERVRMAGMFAMLFQLTLFLGSGEIRTVYPTLSQFVFILAVALQLWIQSRSEKKVRPPDPESAVQDENSIPQTSNVLGIMARAMLSLMIGTTLYVTIFICSIKLALLAADAFHVHRAIHATFLLLGGAVGVIATLVISFVSGPAYIKSIFPTSQRLEEGLLQRFQACFTKLGFKAPHFLVIEMGNLRFSDIMMIGALRGRGPFHPAVFIPRMILNTLTSGECEAMILNQVSHLVLGHVRRRFLFTLSLILITAVIAILSVLIADGLLPGHESLNFTGPAIALVSFFISFRALATQAKKHEFEADLYCIERLGVPFSDLAGALRKLDPQNMIDLLPLKKDQVMGSPEIERRIQLIQEFLVLHGHSTPDTNVGPKVSSF